MLILYLGGQTNGFGGKELRLQLINDHSILRVPIAG